MFVKMSTIANNIFILYDVKIHAIFYVQSILCSITLHWVFVDICLSTFSHSTFSLPMFRHSTFSLSMFSHSMFGLSTFSR